MEYDVVAKSWKGEVVFEGRTDKGMDWIHRHWGDTQFSTNDFLNAASHVKRMNADGLSVVLFCGV